MDILSQLLSEIKKVVSEAVKEQIENLDISTYEQNEKWINRKELAEYLGVSLSWIDMRIREIPHINEPFRFKKSDIDEWLKSKQCEPSNPAVKENKKYKVV